MSTLTELIKESLEGKLSDQIRASLETEEDKINEGTVNPPSYYKGLEIVTCDTLKHNPSKHINDTAPLRIYSPYIMRGAEICEIYRQTFDRNDLYGISHWASEYPMRGWKLIPNELLNTSMKFIVIPYVFNYGEESRLLVFNESRKEMRVLFTNGFFQDKFWKLQIPYKFVNSNWLCNVSGVNNLMKYDDGSIVYDLAMEIVA